MIFLLFTGKKESDRQNKKKEEILHCV